MQRQRKRLVPYAAALAATALMVTSLVVSGGTAQAAPTRYEAEVATISQGVVAATHTGFSGTGYVDYNAVAGSYVEWTVTVAASGTATLAFRHANGSTANRPLSVTVNGTVVAAALAFNPTGAWTTWQTVTTSATLPAGTSTIRATATATAGGPNVDWLEVAAAAPTSDFQAEEARIVQGVVAATASP
jgi:hypothetical protein